MKRLNQLAGVILENTFTSISSMVDSIFPKIAFLKGLVLRNYWKSDMRIGLINEPILFIMAMQDEIVPYSHMVRLAELAKSAKIIDKVIKLKKHVIPDGNHNGSWANRPDEYFRKIKSFIEISSKL